MLVGEALDLGDSLADLLPRDAEALSQLVAKVRLVDVGGGLGVVVDRR
jgi:predicted RNA polymerase sigma factor